MHSLPYLFVFYVKDMSTKPRKRKDKEANASYNEPKRRIVLSGKRNIVGVDDKTDMSGDYENFHHLTGCSGQYSL